MARLNASVWGGGIVNGTCSFGGYGGGGGGGLVPVSFYAIQEPLAGGGTRPPLRTSNTSEGVVASGELADVVRNASSSSNAHRVVVVAAECVAPAAADSRVLEGAGEVQVAFSLTLNGRDFTYLLLTPH